MRRSEDWTEAEKGRPFGIGGKEFERGGEEAVGAGWQARVSAEGEMWLGELAEGRGVDGVVDGVVDGEQELVMLDQSAGEDLPGEI